MTESSNRDLENITGVFELKVDTKNPDIIQGVKSINTIIESHWPKIVNIIEDEKLESLYDTREKSIGVIEHGKNIFSSEEISRLEKIAYNSGQHLLSIYLLIGMMSTNKYFKEKDLSFPKKISIG